jgi:MFS family permease
MTQTTPRYWLRIFLPFAIGYYLSYMLRSTNAVLAPELTRELGLSAADLGLLTSVYLFAFGLFQLPVGLLLDRYGSRRVESVLLIVAAIGCVLFALGHSLRELIIGRALIGAGVSACLMASFKAFSQWFAVERLPSLNAAIMIAAGLGALTASVPLGWLLPILGWRGVFFAVAVITLVIALVIFTTPEKSAVAHQESFGTQLRGLGLIFKSIHFWRFAPQNACFNGAFMALQGLWVVPWLMTVNGYSREYAAFHLMLMAFGMVAGFLSIATLATRLERRGVGPEVLLTIGFGGVLILGVMIVFDVGSTTVLWAGLGLLFSAGNLSYALLARHFPTQFNGRVSTALNVMTFGAAFAVQWGFGAVVDAFSSLGWSSSAAYRGTYGVLILMQLLSFVWFQGVGWYQRGTQSAVSAKQH